MTFTSPPSRCSKSAAMLDNVVTNEEIDALMEAVQSGQVSPPARSGSGRQIKEYDFTRPDKFSKEQMRALEMIHSNLARNLSTHLSAMLRSQAEVEMESIVETSYMEFFDSIDHPATIALLSLEPLVGRALLEIGSGISFALLDRMLGGPGAVIGEPRELTEIEKGLMGRVVERVAKCVDDSWSTLAPIHAEMEMIIGSMLFGQIALPDDRLVLARYVVHLGKVSGYAHIGIPVTALDPVLSRLTAQQWFSGARHSKSDALTDSIRQSLDAAALQLAAELGHANITVQELLDLQVGDLVCLNRKAGADLDVRIGEQVRFRGQPGQVGRRLGLRITQRLDERETE